MAGILNIKKFKEENREELDSIIFRDMIEGFLDRMTELGKFNPDVEITRDYNGKIIHQISRKQAKSYIMNKLLRSRNHRHCYDMKMSDITIDDINWLFGTRIELKNEFLNEIYYKYYV